VFVFQSNCYVYKTGSWRTGPAMVQAINHFAMTKSPFTNKPQSLFVTGGADNSWSYANAEILTDSGWEVFSPSFPVPVYEHCMVLVNSTTVMVAGGIQNGLTSADTYLISDNKKVTMNSHLQQTHLTRWLVFNVLEHHCSRLQQIVVITNT
jgi:hypothetical protein